MFILKSAIFNFHRSQGGKQGLKRHWLYRKRNAVSFIWETTMRALSITSALAFSLVSLSTTNSWATSDMPRGSWKQSCIFIDMAGSTLLAECKKIDGSLVESSLNMKTCARRSTVSNMDGVLTCDKGTKASTETQLPKGSWSESCTNGRMEGSVLLARCRTKSGQMRSASLNVAECKQSSVWNNDGWLSCDTPKQTYHLPAGSWSQSCEGARVEGNTMVATCMNIEGLRVISALDLRTCDGPVANTDGNLTCD
jgi:hypothetical protein